MHASSRWTTLALFMVNALLRGAPVCAHPPGHDVSLASAAAEAIGVRSCEVIHLPESSRLDSARTLTIELAGEPATLHLRRHAVRSADYELLVQDPSGALTPHQPGEINTFRGFIEARPGSKVIGGLVDGGWQLRLDDGLGNRWWIEPLKRRVAEAPAEAHAIYQDAQLELPPFRCGVLQSEDLPDEPAATTIRGASDEMCIARLACDSDVEYFNAYGSVHAVEARISTVINLMSEQYENQTDIFHQLSTLIVRPSSPSPYDLIADGYSLLSQVEGHWRNNLYDVDADLVTLFTGKDIRTFTDGVIGLASTTGGICDPRNKYCLTQSDWNGGNLACAAGLAAHETGHLWNGVHCSCNGSMQFPCLTQFAGVTVNRINAYRQTLACLACNHPPCGGLQQATLWNIELGIFDRFGQSVAIDDSLGVPIIAVGAIEVDGDAGDVGAAYVFQWDGTEWTQTAKLQPDGLNHDEEFGASIALHGETLVVGSWKHNPGVGRMGAAWIFRQIQGAWQFETKLSPNDGAIGDMYGFDVAIDGEVIAVGARGADEGGIESGAVYLYRRAGETWSLEQKILANAPAIGDFFGESVAISGDWLIVGAPLRDLVAANDDRGSAQLFRFDGRSWQFAQQLSAPELQPDDRFGAAVDIAGDVALVGCPSASAFGVDSGAGYFFEFDGLTWNQTTKAIGSDPAPDRMMGETVALTESRAIIGSRNADIFGAPNGAAFYYLRDGSAWVEYGALVADWTDDVAEFATSLDLIDQFGVVGVPQDVYGPFSFTGSARTFTLPPDDANGNGIPDPCDPIPGDLNTDGVVDIFDLDIVLGHFGTHTDQGDANYDGLVDFRDLSIVLGNLGRTG